MNPILNWTMVQALQAETRAEADAAARRAAARHARRVSRVRPGRRSRRGLAFAAIGSAR